MDTQSLTIPPKSGKLKKLSKKEKKLLKKQRKYKNGKGDYWGPIDKTKSITLHLVHRSTHDPLLDIPSESVGEWVLEPEVNCRTDFERVQKFFHDFDLEDTIPHHYRTDEFIEKTSAKSMPILPSQQNQSNYYNDNYLGPIYEENNDKYDYEQHYRCINDSNFVDSKQCVNDKKKKRLKDGVEILEEYIFEQEYELNDNKQDIENKDNDNDNDKLPNHLKQYKADKYTTDKDLEHDPNYKDYIDLLLSDNDDNNDEKQDILNEFEGELQDDFVLHAMGIDEEEFKRIQIGTFEPYGARFAKWNEMDRHYDKYYNKENNNDNNKESLYDQTINHLMNIQTVKERNSYLDNIEEEEDFGQFDDAEDDDDDDDDYTNKGSIAYNPEMDLLDNQFEMMLNKEYGDEFIGELDDDIDGLQGDFPCDTINRFSNKNKKESLRYQYYLYLKHKKRRIRKSLKKSTRDATLQLIAADIINKEEKEIKKEINDDESDEIIYFSDTDSDNHNDNNDKKKDIKDLDSDDERRINAEIDEEFKQQIPSKWDCESILSMRTNHENHPKELKVNVIKLNKNKFIKMENDEIIKKPKQMELNSIHEMKNKNNNNNNNDEMMIFSFGNIDGNDNNDNIIKEKNGKENIFQFNKFDDDDKKYNNNDNINDKDMEKDENKENMVITAYSKRKGETKKQKKLRKTLKKQLKKQRRKEKKGNKEAFKEEQKKQNKLSVTQRKSHGNAIRL